MLREVAAEFLIKRIPPPNELADYAAADLQRANSNKKQSHKTDYRDWILALTVDDVARRFNLKPTRNRETRKHRKHCACSIVAQATKLFEKTVPNAWRSEKTVENAWQKYQGIADQRTATNYVPQARVTVTYDSPREYLMRPPRVVGSDGTQEHFLVRFPRIGSTEAMPRPKP